MLFIVNNSAISLIGTNFFLSGTGPFGLARMYCIEIGRSFCAKGVHRRLENTKLIALSIFSIFKRATFISLLFRKELRALSNKKKMK